MIERAVWDREAVSLSLTTSTIQNSYLIRRACLISKIREMRTAILELQLDTSPTTKVTARIEVLRNREKSSRSSRSRVAVP